MNKNSSEKDIFGNAISAYFHHKDETDILVHSPDFDDDVIPVGHLFRNYAEMPVLEQKALTLCTGKVLDIGCGAGSHALFLQQEKKLKVTALDTSAGAIEICRARGVGDARQDDFFIFREGKYDTLLMLMNGSGIIGKLANLDLFFTRARNLLEPDGKILMDSSDLSYLLDPEEDGGIWVNPEDNYYGELQFYVSYKGEKSKNFNWLYIDFESLKLAAQKNGFSARRIQKGEHYDYLAELRPKTL